MATIASPRRNEGSSITASYTWCLHNHSQGPHCRSVTFHGIGRRLRWDGASFTCQQSRHFTQLLLEGADGFAACEAVYGGRLHIIFGVASDAVACDTVIVDASGAI